MEDKKAVEGGDRAAVVTVVAGDGWTAGHVAPWPVIRRCCLLSRTHPGECSRPYLLPFVSGTAVSDEYRGITSVVNSRGHNNVVGVLSEKIRVTR